VKNLKLDSNPNDAANEEARNACFGEIVPDLSLSSTQTVVVVGGLLSVAIAATVIVFSLQ